MAPAASVAFSILFAAQYAGGATPLAVLVGLGLCLLIAVTIGQMAKHLPSAGGLYTYNARGLGASVGFLVGWAFMMAEVVVAPGGLLILGIVVSGALHTHLGWPTWTWAPAAVLGGVVVWALVLRGIRLSTAASVVLGVFEITVFLALAVTLIVHAGGHNTLAVFSPHEHNKSGFGSLVPGVLYAVFGIIGFEAAAPLGEGARNPKRTIPRAVLFACLSIGLFYLFCYYAATVYFGPSRMTTFADFNAGDPWSGMSNTVWGLGFIVVVVALVNSAIAGSNASSVATTRVGYSLGRIRMLPRVLTRNSPRIQDSVGRGACARHPGDRLCTDPWLRAGRAAQSTCFAGHDLDRADGSDLHLHRRELRSVLSPRAPRGVQHRAAPAHTTGASVFFIPVLLAAFGLDFAGLGIQPLASPASYAPYVIVVWMVLGVIVLGYFAATDRERIAATTLVFDEEAEPRPGVDGTG